MKILIAEDDRDSRELLCWILQKLGYQVVATENGKEAWEAFRRGRFRLVISDVLMPEIDGLELCRRIRKHKQSKYTYIIMITALIGKKDYLEGMEAGADDFVTKPLDPDELKARLRVAERIISFQEHAATEEVDTPPKLGGYLRERSETPLRRILKLDKSCILNPKSEISNWTSRSTRPI